MIVAGACPRIHFNHSLSFQLSTLEAANLRSQFRTSNGYGGRRYSHYVCTEHGAIMLASVLNSDTAIDASIQVASAQFNCPY